MKIYFLLLSALPLFVRAQIDYPPARASDQIDDYFGNKVKDPYRWLEDDKSETVAWVGAENDLARSYLSKIPFRDAFKKKLEEVSDYPKYSAPFKTGIYYYYYRNQGQQNHSVLYRKTAEGAEQVVLDPNIMSSNGTTRLMQFIVSPDGKYAAYSLSEAGSDWQQIYEMDLNTLKQTNDHLMWVKLSNISWQGEGFYYSRYPASEKGKELTSKNENHKVYYHLTGDTQELDKLIYEDKEHPLRFNSVVVSHDEQYIFLTVQDKGKYSGNALYYRAKDQKDFVPIEAQFIHGGNSFICMSGGNILLATGRDTKNMKVVSYNIKSAAITTIIDESSPIQTIKNAGGMIFITYLTDAHESVKVFDLTGHLINKIKLPEDGTVSGFNGEPDDTAVYYTFTSFTYPSTIFSYNIASHISTVFKKSEVNFNPDEYKAVQEFFPSKDGTSVPMYIVYKKTMKKDQPNPTLLYGYGGYGISTLPSFNSYLIPFLNAGGIYVSANIRGGGEYGGDWHWGGAKHNKQNSFDDFIAAAQYLVKRKYTDKDHLAIKGASNGGLLIGAVCNQQPELFRVAIIEAGILDMLRFQKFTIGWNWRPEFGTSDIEDDFNVLYQYSPLHNIKAGAAYPAILATTADHDDRVVPAHTYKYIATMQSDVGKTSKYPILLRVETNSGHSSASGQKGIELTADIYSFIFYNMGLAPKF